MAGTLDPEVIAAALGEHTSLPSPEEVADALEEAEVQLFLHQPEIPEELLHVAWYLHGVASSPETVEAYSTARRRRCFQVSAHIFDLALDQERRRPVDRLRLAFASQVGYIQSEINPNAKAILRRIHGDVQPKSLLGDFSRVALALGCQFLGFDRGTVYGRVQSLIEQADSIGRDAGVTDLGATAFGATVGVARAINHLMIYLLYGHVHHFEAAVTYLADSVEAPGAKGDLDARWVASHLLRISGGLTDSSVWGALPPDVPAGVRKAFALSDPPVLTLWPPQLRLVRDAGANPFANEIRRVFLSFPTSAGKTLLSQLFAVTHLSTGAGSVAYVAPTRSLCREVRSALRSRLGLLRREVGLRDSVWDLDSERPPEVEVMTPEALAHLMRVDPVATLERFGLFIIDEAHTVGDTTRGLTLEGTLALLHLATRETHHKLVVLSPAIGNRIHFREWLDPLGEGLAWHEDWRGPRRLTSIFTSETRPDDAFQALEQSSRARVRRAAKPLFGVIRLQTGEGRQPRRLRTSEPVGTLVVRPDENYRKDGLSTPFYLQLVPLLQAIGRAGPVLVISPTKKDARLLASALADQLPTSEAEVQELADFVASRVGSAHPAVSSLRRGVAIHYASLPNDVLTAIEEIIKASQIPFIVATTTLTEGVNLPVRSVLIAAEGAYTRGGYAEFINGARMINALGRAGRAGRESEGWVILARNAAFNANDFERVNISADAVTIESELVTQEALRELSALEENIADSADAIIQSGSSIAPRFVSFLWFVMGSLEKLGYRIDEGVASLLVENTLAWQQLTSPQRANIVSIGRSTARVYVQTDSATRARWAAAGTSIGTAKLLDEMAREIASDCHGRENLDEPISALALIAANQRLETLLRLPEAPQRGFRSRPTRGSVVEVDLASLVAAWLLGEDLPLLATRFLLDVEDESFRLEQLVEYVTESVTHFLSWIVGLLVEWTNGYLEADSTGTQLPASLSAFLREGVSSLDALQLIRTGVRSRRIANLVSLEYRQAIAGLDVTPSLKEWIAELPLEQWNRFEPSRTDVVDLLEFSRAGTVLSELFDQVTIEIPLTELRQEHSGSVQIREVPEETELRRIGVWRGGTLIAYIPTNHQREISDLLRVAVPYEAWTDRERPDVLLLRLPEPEDPSAQRGAREVR